VNFRGGLVREPGEDAGSYAITLGNLQAEGYQIEFIPSALTIAKATPNVTVETFSGIYDGIFHGLTGRASGVNGEDLSSLLDMGPSYKEVPGGPASWFFKGDDNYLSIQGSPLTVMILPRELVVSADVLTKTYGDPDPEFTFQITGGSLVPGDQIQGRIYRSPIESVGLYALDLSHLTAGVNYRLARVSAWFRVSPRAVTVAADPQRTELNADLPSLSFHILEGSLALGDSFSGNLGRPFVFGKGLYPITQGTLALTTNYAFRFLPANLEVFDPAGEADEDGDGVVNLVDNCGYMINKDQADEDGDGFGDVCDNADDRLFASMIMPVTGVSGSIQVPCDLPVSLGLADGSGVTLKTDQCGLTAAPRVEEAASIPKPLPGGSTFLGALSLNLQNGQNGIESLPRSSRITFSIQTRAGLPLDNSVVYYWDADLDSGLGDWVKIPGFVAIRGEPIDFPLYPGSEKITLIGVKQAGVQRLVFHTNFPGFFVVASQ
jgi:hypothetical protein